MDANRGRDVLLFALGLGGLVFLASALWSALFLVPVPQDADWCMDAIEFESGPDETEWQCVEYKNELEQLKYYHNVEVRDRNRWWVYATLIFGAFAGSVAFYVLPKWRGILDPGRGDLTTAVLAGVLAALIVPGVLGWVLPPPATWFPREIAEIAELRRDAALRDLERQAGVR